MPWRWLGAAVAVPSLVAVGLVVGSLLSPDGGPGGVLPGRHPAAFASAGHAHNAGERTGTVANAERRRVLVFRTTAARRPWRSYANPTAQGTPLVFLVRARAGRWLRVMLPSRPNGAEGWIRADGVELRTDPYTLLVDLRARRLTLGRAGRTVLATAVGVGRAATPTPSGLYYVTELLRQPDPNGLYGPWAFALSAHSSVLTHFAGGDGQVGIHGTDEPLGIGHTVSHGCIRVPNRVIERLAEILPLGTPVRIVANTHSRRSRKFTRT